jgi:nitrogen fixation/metabolism regulation signal transduction histidine kinase
VTLRTSLAGRTAIVLAAVAALAIVVALALAQWFGRTWIAALAALLLVMPAILWSSARATRPWAAVLRAVADGITSFKDRDFSVSVTPAGGRELEELVQAYNSLGEVLRRERLHLYQRELLLDTVIQTTPLALVLTNAVGTVVYSNIAARQLFLGGRKLEGYAFAQLLAASPAPLREAVESEEDRLFTLELDGEPQVQHLWQRHFLLNSQPHRLVLLKQLTRELAAQEVAIWKRVIRVIAHELNNSLAPISSLAHSGALLAQAPDSERLARVFATIADRAAHLASFIDGYARFAKLPRPRKSHVQWGAFLDGLAETASFDLEGVPPAEPACFDASQMEQVLINLLKNAAESGSAPGKIRIAVRHHGEGVLLEVKDRGEGLREDVLRDALLPFYSTKPAGTGLGLTLCREIVEAHGGRLSIANREGGGAIVSVWLPRD